MGRLSWTPPILCVLLVLAIVTSCTAPPATQTPPAPPTTPPTETSAPTPTPSPAPTPTPAPSSTPTPAPIPKPTPTLPQVKIDSGLVSGAVVGDGQVHVYLGIPYAAPPVGDLRWKPPQPVAPWTGVRQCTRFGPASLQPTHQAVGMSEDCLYLNVYTPARTASNRLPVMVFFHGGGNYHGAGSDWSGTLLAQQGVVVVTVNYRLGPLGWLAHPLLSKESPDKVSGNYGLLDDVAALKWVQTNIAAFGGDAGNVTIFGQSAGACTVIHLMASPLAKGLFHRAIVLSGVTTVTQSTADAERQGEAFVARLGVSGAPDVLKALRAKSAEEIVAAAGEALGLFAGGTTNFKPKPVVDGWVLPDRPDKAFRDGKQHNVPLIMGANSGDTRDFFSSTLMLVDYMSKVQPKVYVYEFTRVPPGWRKAGIPAMHLLDQFYQFGTIDQIDRFGKEMHGVPAELDPVVDGRVSKEMMALWTQFAATGDPNVKGMVSWPTYNRASDQYLDIGDTLQVKSGFSKITPTPYIYIPK